MLKFQVIHAVRAVGLLGLADTGKFWLWRLLARRRNSRFVRRHPGFVTPPPELAFDAYNHIDWTIYRETGQAHAGFFARVIRAARPDGERLDLLEWGCGPGRIVRHMPTALTGRVQSLTGVDSNAQSIAWCTANLPEIRFVRNAQSPRLPFNDASFDVVYAYSVFTHLSESAQIDWARELKRVLRVGGFLICSTQGRSYEYLLASRSERRRFAAGGVVVQGNYEEGKKWFFAISPQAFVRTRLLAGFADVSRIPTTPEDDIPQDVWMATKAAPDDRSASKA